MGDKEATIEALEQASAQLPEEESAARSVVAQSLEKRTYLKHIYGFLQGPADRARLDYPRHCP